MWLTFAMQAAVLGFDLTVEEQYRISQHNKGVTYLPQQGHPTSSKSNAGVLKSVECTDPPPEGTSMGCKNLAGFLGCSFDMTKTDMMQKVASVPGGKWLVGDVCPCACGKTPRSSPSPTIAPTSVLSVAPTAAPTAAPTSAPTAAPSPVPTAAPTAAPTDTTNSPTKEPTKAPTAVPTVVVWGEVTFEVRIPGLNTTDEATGRGRIDRYRQAIADAVDGITKEQVHIKIVKQQVAARRLRRLRGSMEQR
jgi:hypothetical protein